MQLLKYYIIIVSIFFLGFHSITASAQSGRITNPRYEDEITDTESEIFTMLKVIPERFFSENKAINYVRSQMVDRIEIISFEIVSGKDEKTFISNFLTALVDGIEKDTGNPLEGDYLVSNYRFADFSVDHDKLQDGKWLYKWTFKFRYNTTKVQEEETTKLIQKTLSKLDLWNASQHDRIEGIYKWITSNVSYDHKHLNIKSYTRKYTAYAAIKDRTAVCEGYALLFYRMAKELDLSVEFVVGTVGDGTLHAWNMVKIGNEWYNLDSTWDAGHDKFYWFLRSDFAFPQHTRGYRYSTEEFIIKHPVSKYCYDEQKPISKSDIKLSKAVYYYTGKARKPSISVKVSGKTLKKDRDYTIVYKDNINVGFATVIVKGIGKYRGTTKKTFRIAEKLGSVIIVDGMRYKVTGFDTVELLGPAA